MPQLFIKLQDGKFITIEASLDENIIGIKKKIQEKTGISANDQRIFFNLAPLEDGNTIRHYELGCGETLCLIVRLKGDTIKINVKSTNGKMLQLDVASSENIIDIKRKIHKSIGVSVEEQILVFKNQVIAEDSVTVEECKMCEGDTISLAVQSIKMSILVTAVDSRTTLIETMSKDKIVSIKRKVEEVLNLAHNDHELLFGDKVLLDDSTVGGCGIHHNDVIVVRRSKMNVSVRTADGKVNLCDLLRTDNGADIKLKIGKKIGQSVEDHVLIYNKVLLEDLDQVDLDKLHSSSTISVIPYPRNIKVLIASMDGRKLTFDVRISDTVASLKCKVQEKWGVSPDRQTLVCLGQVLSDVQTLTAYNICDRSTVYMVD